MGWLFPALPSPRRGKPFQRPYGPRDGLRILAKYKEYTLALEMVVSMDDSVDVVADQ